ncbi:hypothetical protein L7F22_057764 [Adiantum nelumboides]|nr:hypothetical protein [Adiantum nelumboides]
MQQAACTTSPFPCYELHQVAAGHGDQMATTPSAMDILCEIVNSEYSHTASYSTVAAPEVALSSTACGSYPPQKEKESLLNILHSSGSKAMEIIENTDVQMIHAQHPSSYSMHMHYTEVPSMSFMPTTTQSAFPTSPEMHPFKLPLLEQEPETSLTNSQVDEEFKHKEIRRNLERFMVMQPFKEACPNQAAPCLGLSTIAASGAASTEAAEGMRVNAERHEIWSSCSANPIMPCDGFEHVEKVSMSCSAKNMSMSDGGERAAEYLCVARVSQYAEEARSRVSSAAEESKPSSLKRKGSAARYGVEAGSSSSKKATSDSGSRLSEQEVSRANRVAHSSSGMMQMKGGEAKRLHVQEGQIAAGSAAWVGMSGQRRANAGQGKMSGASAAAAGALHIGAASTSEDQAASYSMMNDSSCKEQRSTPLTHISVERNRRKQMNEHLAILRSLMPSSYVQRSDQASIIGGVVEFVKELQQLLTSLETQKRRRAYVAEALSPRVSAGSGGPSLAGSKIVHQHSPHGTTSQELVATSRSPLADVEVKLAGGAHVLLRTLSHKATHGQLVHLIEALECMSLEILHLNIATLQQSILYTFTLKIGIECRLSVDDLADIGQQIFKDIHSRRL